MSNLPIFKNTGKGIGKASEGARKIGRGLRKAGLDDIADDLIELSPVGGYWKAIKGLGRILGLGDHAPESAIADAMEGATPEQKTQIAELIVREKEAAYADAANERDNDTVRWQADAMGDSWLSKNIRPLALSVTIIAAIVYELGFLALLFWGPSLSEWEADMVADIGSALWRLALGFAGIYGVGRSAEKITILPKKNWVKKLRPSVRATPLD